MVTVLTSSRFEPETGQRKDYNIRICRIPDKITALRNRTKKRLVR